jgi:hypothetical protein
MPPEPVLTNAMFAAGFLYSFLKIIRPAKMNTTRQPIPMRVQINDDGISPDIDRDAASM